MTFSGETNPPSATYADSVVCPLSTSAHSTLVASASAVSDEDYCDSKEPLIIKGSSRSNSTSAVFLTYPPIGPASNWHWGIPQGAGLRGGAGETSLNNGGSSCGHPPASGSFGGGGTNNTVNQGQLGAESCTANQRNSAAGQRPSGAPPPGSSGPQVVNQQLPTGAQQQHQPQRAWDAERKKIEDKWVRFVKKGNYEEEEYQALITSLKDVLKKKLILIQRVGYVLNEELISLQKQRIDLLKTFMSRAAVKPSNRKRRAREDSKRVKKTKTDKSTEAKGPVNTDSNSQVITTDFVLAQHRFE